MNAVSSLVRCLRPWKTCRPSPNLVWYGVCCRGIHIPGLRRGDLPHEDATFVSKMVRDVSEEDIERAWAIIGMSSISLKGVSQCAEKMCKDPKDVLRLCTVAFRSRYNTSQIYKNFMMEMYAKAGFLHHARVMLEASLEKGVVPRMDAWETLAQCGKNRRRPDFAKQIVEYMDSFDVSPPKRILKILMDAYADSRMPEEALQVLALIRKRGMLVDAHAYTVCVKACIGRKCGDAVLDSLVNDIMEDVEKIPHRLWTTILMAYASKGNVSKVLSQVNHMESIGIELNAKDFTAMLRSCREGGDIVQGKEMLLRVEHANVDGELSVATEMIRLYAMCNDIESSMRVFDDILRSRTSLDRGICNIMIDVCMNHWSDSTDYDEKRRYMAQAKKAFDMAWSQGIFGANKHSKKGRTRHMDLHRSGLWASQLIIMKSIDDEAKTFVSGKRIGAIKFITGKGQGIRDSLKVSLSDIVRAFLYQSGIVYHEDSLGVFNIPKGYLEKLFRSGMKYHERTFSLVDPRLLVS